MSLVRTVPGHLMRPSKAKDEFSEAGTCRAQAEPKQKTSRRRSLSLVRTVPGHLMRPSKAKDEFSEAGTCRAQAGNEPEAKFEFSCLASREAASGRFEWSNGIY